MYYDQFNNLTPLGHNYLKTTGQMPPRAGGGMMDPETFRKQQRTQGAVAGAAGLADITRGIIGQRGAEQNIEEIGAELEGLETQMQGVQAPTSEDVLAAATRNAALLGTAAPQQDPSAELAAAKMAMESGADPSAIQRRLSESLQAEEAAAGQAAGQRLSEATTLAQGDLQGQYQREMSDLERQYQAMLGQLESEQQRSLQSQALTQRGTGSTVSGLAKYLSNLEKKQGTTGDGDKTDVDEAKENPPLGGGAGINFSMNDPNYDPTGGYDPLTEEDPTLIGDNRINNNRLLTASQAQGGAVQKTPGEYNHDTNDMILMAQGKDGMLVDTGIRQTGGEFVIDPYDAGEMRQKHEKIDPIEVEKAKKNGKMSKELQQNMIALYDAVRFIEEPQFQENYIA